MRQLNETFEDSEFNSLKKFKGKLTWKVFILLMFSHCKEAEKKGDFKIFKQ